MFVGNFLQIDSLYGDITEPELIPRAKFGLTKNNAHAHIGIGAVDDAELRKLLSEEVPEDQPPEAHALVALAFALIVPALPHPRRE